MVYRNHLVLILGHRLFSEVIQYFRCTLGCLDISSDIQCAVFKEQFVMLCLVLRLIFD